MKITENNVVQQLQKRNEEALHYIIDHYGGLIKSIMSRHLYQFRYIHEECMDDILLGIWHNIDSFNSEKSSLKNWIAAISKYKAIDYKRMHVKFLEQQSLEENDLVNPLDDEKRELSLEMEDLLSQLKREDWELLINYYVEEIDTVILAEDLQVEQSVIYNRLSRGRKRLKKLFGSI